MAKRVSEGWRRWDVQASVCFALAFLLRIYWVLYVQAPADAVVSDMAGYIGRAEASLVGRPVSLCFPYGTHVLYRGMLQVFGSGNYGAIAVVQATLGALCAPIAVAAASRIWPQPWTWFTTGVAVSLWMPQVWYVGFFASELLYTFFLTASFWLWLRFLQTGRGGGWAGLVTAVGVTVRPPLLLIVGMIGVWCVVRRKRLPWLSPSRLVWAGAPIVVVLALSSARYMYVTGEVGLISTNGSLARFYADTNYLRAGSWHPKGPKQVEEVAESLSRGIIPPPPKDARVGYFQPGSRGVRQGFREEFVIPGVLCKEGALLDAERRRVLSERGPFWRAWTSQRNIWLLGYGNTPWPERNFWSDPPWREGLARRFGLGVQGLLIPLCGFGLLTLVSRRNTGIELAALYVVTLLATAAFFFAEVRYRVPYDMMLILLALHPFAGGRDPVQDRWIRIVWGSFLAGLLLLLFVDWPKDGGLW